MAPIIKKNKKKTLKKKETVKPASKFLSQALVNRRKKKSKKRRPKTKGLVFIKNLPHGFFEEQLRGYFSQFGAVTRLRLGRSPKTLESRGYAFVEFRYPEVAQIAAEAMNNYVMFHRIVKTKYIAPTEIHHDYFRSNIFKMRENGEKILTSRKLLVRKAIVEQTNRLMTDDDQKNRINIAASRHRNRKRKLEALGIDFDLDSIAMNLSEDVIKEPERTVLTINNLKEEDLDDDADETFDPAEHDIESDDEFIQYVYAVDDSASEDELMAKNKALKIAEEIKIETRAAKLEAKKAAAKSAPVEVEVKQPAKKAAAKSAPVEVEAKHPAKRAKKALPAKSEEKQQKKPAKKAAAANVKQPAQDKEAAAKELKKPAKKQQAQEKAATAKAKQPVQEKATTAKAKQPAQEKAAAAELKKQPAKKSPPAKKQLPAKAEAKQQPEKKTKRAVAAKVEEVKRPEKKTRKAAQMKAEVEKLEKFLSPTKAKKVAQKKSKKA